jgi:hypothetical protein
MPGAAFLFVQNRIRSVKIMAKIKLPTADRPTFAVKKTRHFDDSYKELWYAPPAPQKYDHNRDWLRNSLWCITQYFNPLGHHTRKRNFALFHEHLMWQTNNLLVVEVALSKDQFELHRVHPHEQLIQIVDTSLIWQKERIFNLCLNWLPKTCTKVVWLDCDVLFDSHEWVYETSALLNDHAVVQPYFQNARLPATISNIDYGIDLSKFPHGLGDETRADGEIHALFRRNGGLMSWSHPGYACGYQRELLEKHGLYDRCIAGSSDQLIYQAVIGDYYNQKIIEERYTIESCKHYRKWAIPFHNAIEKRYNFVRHSNLYHLYHGRPDHRQYHSRLATLKLEFDFNHAKDIVINPETGLFQFSTEAAPRLRQWLDKYYRNRRDDR